MTYLRKALVGSFDYSSSSKFYSECSDVDLENGSRTTLGDIGDVIQLRRRILNEEWDTLS